MARVYVEEHAHFECPKCGGESQCDPGVSSGQTVICGECGASHRVGEVGYMVINWNDRNRKKAKQRKSS